MVESIHSGQRMKWTQCGLTVAVVLAMSLAGIPAEALRGAEKNASKDVHRAVKKLQARYEKTKDLKADFTQVTRIEGFATPLTSSGRFFIKKPGLLRWDYRDPTVEEIYVNQNTVNMYVPAHKQVLVGELTKMTASQAPLQLLQGVANLAEEFAVLPTRGGKRGAGGLPLVTLIPKPAEHESVQSMKKIVIELEPSTYYLKRVSIHEVSGNISTFEFTNLKANTGLSDKLFRFRVPPGVEVVKAPQLEPP